MARPSKWGKEGAGSPSRGSNQFGNERGHELLATRDHAESERNAHFSDKIRAENELKRLRIRVTTAEQEITERKLQLVSSQDEAVGLRVQAKTAEEMAGRRIEVDLPGAQIAHNDLREERP